jgi:hypothetical protein
VCDRELFLHQYLLGAVWTVCYAYGSVYPLGAVWTVYDCVPGTRSSLPLQTRERQEDVRGRMFGAATKRYNTVSQCSTVGY